MIIQNKYILFNERYAPELLNPDLMDVDVDLTNERLAKEKKKESEKETEKDKVKVVEKKPIKKSSLASQEKEKENTNPKRSDSSDCGNSNETIDALSFERNSAKSKNTNTTAVLSFDSGGKVVIEDADSSIKSDFMYTLFGGGGKVLYYGDDDDDDDSSPESQGGESNSKEDVEKKVGYICFFFLFSFFSFFSFFSIVSIYIRIIISVGNTFINIIIVVVFILLFTYPLCF